MREMGREDKQAFNKRDRKDSYNHHGNKFEDLTYKSRDKKQGHKGNHIGHNTKDNRHSHLSGPFDSRLKHTLPLTPMKVDILANYNSIVDNYAQCDNKGKHGDHIQAEAGQRQDKK